MHLRQSGQAVLLSVLLLGSIMALIVVFGGKRQNDVHDIVTEMSEAQQATEALTAAARRIQRMYTAEAGCDPDVLDSRLSRLPELPASADGFGLEAGTMSYAIAQPGAGSAAERQNRCAGGVGCRQIGIPLEKRVFVVTVGEVVADDDPDPADPADCPRDATVRLSVAVNGDLFYRRVTLVNTCTIASCPTATSTYSFKGISGTITGWPSTTACGSLPARMYGSVVSGTVNIISVEDLRWARRYLDTGGGSVGDTTYANGSSSSQNIACAAAAGTQCYPIPCVPPFDLNRDKTNNEADLAILEYYLRGYIPQLPVTRLN